MNDVILSSILNLFALFGSSDHTERQCSEAILRDYLTHHFGIKGLEEYLALYNELRDFYDDMEDVDTELLIASICTRLQGKITAEEQHLMLLRVMEFCAVDGQDWEHDAMFRTLARTFQVPERIYEDMVCFLGGPTESKYVKHITYEGIPNRITTLYIKPFDLLLFATHGEGQLLMNDVPIHTDTFQVWQRSGVVKSPNEPPFYYYMALELYAKAKKHKREDIVLEARDVNFRFATGGDNGTHNLNFQLHGGTFVAIMGGSGAGKSTLLSVLNGTLRPQQGSVTINGIDIHDARAKDLIGFVPQDDLLIEELTVRQNLWYTARLCFQGMADDLLCQRVDSVLADLGLTPAADLKVGSPINKYISGGQRKRLNIALELIREPAILYLDEPTSGLSSADAEMIVNLLKEQAFRGCLVIANIHQPSSDVFKLFDILWMLDRGGYPIYFGNPIEAITYFKHAAGHADAETSMCPVCGNVNPEVILNIIEEKALDDSGKVTTQRKTTPQEWHQRFRDSQEPPLDDTFRGPLPQTQQRRPSPLQQVGIFLQRTLQMKATNLQYIIITLLEAPLLATICALLTRYAPPEGYTLLDNSNLVSYYFMAVIVAIFLGMSGSAEEIIKDRALVQREQFLSLSYHSYIWSKIIFMAAVTCVQTLLFTLVGNTIMGITCLFGTWWLILWLSAFLAGLTGLWLSKNMSSVVAIYITIPLLLIPQILLCGLVVKFSDLNPRSTTGNVPLIGNVIPSRWAFEALAVTSFTDNDYEQHFFEGEREKYTTLYYERAYTYELQSQLEKIRQQTDTTPEVHLAVLRYSLPLLADICGTQPYSGDYSYESLHPYLDECASILRRRSNRATLALDAQTTALIRSHGREAITALKRDNHNLWLEQLVSSPDAKTLCRVTDGHIVPQAGFIYLDPVTHCGNAPFYSSHKYLGRLSIKTLWFNLGILALMSLIVIATLLHPTTVGNIIGRCKKLKKFKRLEVRG